MPPWWVLVILIGSLDVSGATTVGPFTTKADCVAALEELRGQVQVRLGACVQVTQPRFLPSS